MPDKKEVFEYLRNRQKSAEIEAKVNGINLWVLLGAIAIVFWQLVDSLAAAIWSRHDICLRVLLVSVAAYLFSSITAPTRGVRNEIRYSSWRARDVVSPLLNLIFGMMVLLPAAFSFMLVGKTLASIIIGIFGAGIIAISVQSIVVQFLNDKIETEKFPKLDFSQTRRADMIGTLTFGLIFLGAIGEQILALAGERSTISIEDVRALALLGALYLLIIITIRRKQASHSIAWTYELETDLLLEVVTPEVALRRIEHRSLGPRLQDVMDRFFDDIDRRFAELDSSLADCRGQLSSISDIPAEYSAERAARIAAASNFPKCQIEELLKDCSEFSSYLKKISELRSGSKRPGIAALLPSLGARHATYEARAKAANREVNDLLLRVAR